MGVVFWIKFLNVSVIKEGVNENLKMFRLSVKAVDRGKLPPLSSSICDKIFKSQCLIF